jgi:hypothetical protein
MGTNTPNQTPGAYGAFAQDPTTQALATRALTPYQGTAAGGGAANGVGQVAAALLANQRRKQWQNKYGIPTYNNPAALPGAVSPGGGMQATQPAQSPVMQSDPTAGMGTYA